LRKGDEEMKKRRLLRVTVLMVALLFVSSAAVAVQPSGSGTIDCVLDITYDEWEPGVFYWFGTITGPECSVAGDIQFVEGPAFEAGKTLHFTEEFTIWPDSGGEIYGMDWGVWNFSTLKFRAQGWVTDATPEWEHLVGSHYHEMGWTSDPNFIPIYAPDGQMRIAPSNRPFDD
jgi:hypothetical protein